jgi:hypothetical protein
MQIQIDIPKELNKKLKLFKTYYDFKTLQDAVLFILDKSLERELK